MYRVTIPGRPLASRPQAPSFTRIAAGALCLFLVLPVVVTTTASEARAIAPVSAATPATTAPALGPWRATGPTRTFVDRLTALGSEPTAILTDGASGLWRSGDDGLTWTVPDGLPQPGPGVFTASTSLGVDPTDARSALLAVGNVPGFDLYRSADAGASWTRVETDALAESIVFGLAVVPAAPSGPATILVVDGEAGLLRSTDGGTTFVPATAGIEPDPDAGVVSVGSVASSATPGVAFASTTTALYRTVDGGASWAAVCRVTETSPCGKPTVAPADPRLVLLAGLTGIQRSDDAGTTWTHVGAGVLPGQDDGGIESISMSATAPTIALASGSTGVFRSGDGGRTWSAWNGGLEPLEFAAADRIALDPADPSRAWRVHGTGFFASTDGGASWLELSGPDPSGTPSYAALAADGAVALAATDGGVYKRVDAGWQLTTSAAPVLAFASDPGLPGRVYAATYAAGVEVSDDGGATWAPWSRGLPRTVSWAVAVMPGPDRRAILASDMGVFARRPAGSSWRRLGAGLPDAAARTVVVLGDGGIVAGLEGHGAWRLDRGTTQWRPIGLGVLSVVSVAALSRDGRALLAATASRGVWRTTDGGATWRRTIGTGASASLAYDPISRVAVVSSGVRVHASSDGGRTWRRLESGLPRVDPDQAWVRRTTAVAAVAGGGIVLSTFGGTYIASPAAASR